MTSTIHDLGYQRYAGARRPPRDAWGVLFVQGLRAVFGLGGNARAKTLPALVVVVSTLPAIFGVLITRVGLTVNHGTLFASAGLFYVLFAGAQGGELLTRDQADQVRPLLLTRDLSPVQYATARMASLMFALFLLLLVPHVVLWVGRVGLNADAAGALREALPLWWPMLGACLAAALLLGALASAVAVSTSKRWVTTTVMTGGVIVWAGLLAALGRTPGVSAEASALASPLALISSAQLQFFNAPLQGQRYSLGVHLLVMFAITCVAAWYVVWRTRRAAL